MSQPPVERERRVLYTDFSLPTDEGARSPNEAVLRRIRGGRRHHRLPAAQPRVDVTTA